LPLAKTILVNALTLQGHTAEAARECTVLVAEDNVSGSSK
jgi:hypothetical protein